MAERDEVPTTNRDEIAQLIERIERAELREANRQKLSRCGASGASRNLMRGRAS